MINKDTVLPESNKDYSKLRIFRAKDIDTGAWAYGAYLSNGYPDKIKNSIIETDGRIKKIDSDTLCEFTRQYDSNKRMIFEGDILKFRYSDSICTNEAIGVVMYYGTSFVLKTTSCVNNIVHLRFNPESSVVIGNMYDCKQLLNTLNIHRVSE